jgi:DNA polymerase-3 subunit delta
MRIKLEQLGSNLKNKLLPIYLVSGDEPLLVQEAVMAIREEARRQSFDERKVLHVDKYFSWDSLNEEANSLSLFSNRQILEIKLGNSKPGAPGSKALLAYCSALPDDKILIIEAAKFDAKTLKSKWASAIDKAGAIIQIWPITSAEMPRWIERRAKQFKLGFEPEALALLSSRLEGNLLAAQQELSKLSILHSGDTISAEQVFEEVRDSAKYDIFDLTGAIVNGQAKQCSNILAHLEAEGSEITMALWAISKEIRLLVELSLASGNSRAVFNKHRVIERRQHPLNQAAKRHSLSVLQTLLARCKTVDDAIKGVNKHENPWRILNEVCIKACGTNLVGLST